MEVKKKMNPNELRSLQEAYLEVVNGQQLDEAMSSYDRNRKRAAQRAAERNAARAAGKTGVVPGVGYVSPRKERETYTDEKGTVRHKSGAKMEEVQNVDEVYKGRHGQSDKEYADSRSQGGKMISGDSKMSGAEYTHGRRVKAENPGMQPDVGGKTKPKSQGRMDSGTRNYLKYRKANLKKEEVSVYDIVLSHLIDEGYADTVEGAEGIMLNMSEEWRDSIVEADSLAAMQARREKRLAAQRKREGTTASGRDFGHDYSLTPAQQKARRDAEFKAGIGTKK